MMMKHKAEAEFDAIEAAAKKALEQRCERGTPWDLACVTIAAAIRANPEPRRAYVATHVEVLGLLKAIGDDLTSHAQRYAPFGHTWAAVGDLQRVAGLLREVHQLIRAKP